MKWSIMLITAILINIVLIFNYSKAQQQDIIQTGIKPEEFELYGYLVRGAAWEFDSGQKRIFVCWENPTVDNQTSRSWIRDQIEKTWQLHSAVNFRGWEKCAIKNSGIRILISDEGPRVKAFGLYIDGIKEGMILNDTFKNWSQSCQKQREACVRSIAVHEFGHALGFAHEQNRPDAPGECSRRHGQGQTGEMPLTSYDLKSVMNYCNPEYNNKGNLSELDIKSVQSIYGRR